MSEQSDGECEDCVSCFELLLLLVRSSACPGLSSHFEITFAILNLSAWLVQRGLILRQVCLELESKKAIQVELWMKAFMAKPF
jgi:hypothetical protein